MEPMINQEILARYHATLLKLKKGEFLFHQGDTASFFHIVRHGKVKMLTYNEEGREFVQGYFTDGQSFGEPPFFNRVPYPASASAVTDAEVWRCPYEPFMNLLRDHFEIHLGITQALSGRLLYKAMMLSEIAVEEADHRLKTLIDYFKKSDSQQLPDEPYKVPFTRQQLADMTGLRVETVIRSIKSMEQQQLLSLDEGGKIIWHGITKRKE